MASSPFSTEATLLLILLFPHAIYSLLEYLLNMRKTPAILTHLLKSFVKILLRDRPFIPGSFAISKIISVKNTFHSHQWQRDHGDNLNNCLLVLFFPSPVQAHKEH